MNTIFSDLQFGAEVQNDMHQEITSGEMRGSYRTVKDNTVTFESLVRFGEFIGHKAYYADTGRVKAINFGNGSNQSYDEQGHVESENFLTKDNKHVKNIYNSKTGEMIAQKVTTYDVQGRGNEADLPDVTDPELFDRSLVPNVSFEDRKEFFDLTRSYSDIAAGQDKRRHQHAKNDFTGHLPGITGQMNAEMPTSVKLDVNRP